MYFPPQLIQSVFMLPNASYSAPSTPYSFVAIHTKSTAKIYLHDIECYDFANDFTACIHYEDPTRIPGTIVSSPNDIFTTNECFQDSTWNLARIQKIDNSHQNTYGV